MKFYIYDLETYENFFSFTGKYYGDSTIHTFELSTRKNERQNLLAHLSEIQYSNAFMVGYNNLGFDYPIIHELLQDPYNFDFTKARHLCAKIIGSQNYGFSGVSPRDRIIPQIDLVKINHFDNANKRTSLKDLQFAMRSKSLEVLPYDPSLPLTSEQMDHMISYNVHDVTETEAFLKECLPLIQMRRELIDNGVISGDVYNFSDVKIGTEVLIKRIGKGKCFIGSKPRQTFREKVSLANVILPGVNFRSEPFLEVLDWFKDQTVYIAGSERPKLEKRLAGVDFHFGVGGVHASVDNKVYRSTDKYVIRDIDVSGMYVAVAISNGFYPEHLGRDFISAYTQLQRDRALHPKGTTMNAVLKLAGNGVYGNSNNPYSPFYDPKYQLLVTVNGQLQLLQLVELLSFIPGLEIIQANTDGITAYFPREHQALFDMWCKIWEDEVKLKLEHVDYKAMWIRDVNNYIAQTTDGKVKRKGAYWYPTSKKDYEGQWNKNFSKMCVQKVIGECLVNGWKASDILPLVADPFDFLLRYKATGKSKLYIGDNETTKTVRYYISTQGSSMRKVAPPKGEIGAYKRKPKVSDALYTKVLNGIPAGTWDERIHTKNKSKYQEVTTTIEKGFLVKECNHIDKFCWDDLDYNYYLQEIVKLNIGDSDV